MARSAMMREAAHRGLKPLRRIGRLAGLGLGALVRAVVYGQLWIAAGAVSMAQWNRHELGQPLSVDALLGTIAAATWLVYTLDRQAPTSPEDEHDPTPAQRWHKGHARALRAGLVPAAGLTLVGAWSLPPAALVTLVALGVVSIGYSVPLLPWAGRRARLKAWPGMKLGLIAGVWATVTVSLPALVAGRPWGNAHVWAMWAGRAALIASITIPFDVRDAERDAGAQLQTIAHKLGPRRALRLGVLGALCAGTWPGQPVGQGLIAAALIAAAHPRRASMYYAGLLDGVLLLPWPLLWLTQQLGGRAG